MNPISNPERAEQRRAVVLGRMLAEGFITDSQYRQALAEPIATKLHGAEVTMDAPYLAEMVRAEMVNRYGEEMAYTSGFKVYITANAKQQRAAQQAVRLNLHGYDERHGYRGPEQVLWPADAEPSTAEAINKHLQTQENIGLTEPAVVIEVAEQQATVQLSHGRLGRLAWSALAWARPYLHADRQGLHRNKRRMCLKSASKYE